jgi:hypothetical protein
MNFFVNKFRYIVYPAEGPRPPDAEEVAAKLIAQKERLAAAAASSRQKRLKKDNEETIGRKKWLGIF